MRANMTFKKGFTLVELLAVIVVLAVILAIAVPGISSLITNIKKSAFESNVKMLFKHFGYEKLANANFDITTITEQNITDYNLPNSNYKVMKISIVDDNPYAVIIGKNKWDGLTACGTSKSVNIVKTGNDEICEDIGIVMPFVAYDEVKGVNRPKLYGGMTPVIWADGSWQDTTSDNPDWYNYTDIDKKWANARTNDGSLWVWVPRFAYQMETGYHTNTAGTINIKFLKYNTNTATDDTTVSLVPEYSGSSQTNYIVHPAFINGDDPLTGIWVAKFEAGGTIGNIDILPNVASLRNQTIGSFFDAGYNMRYNTKYGWNMGKVDSHMMKNTEWSAISYLAKSIYGKNAEIYPNSSNTFITGCSGNASNASNYSGCQYAYSTVEGNQASTTGNIYGIYDMSGGANEYVSFYINNNNAVLATNGSSIINASDRYKNYFTPSSDTSANNYINDYVKYGHNMYETSSTDTGVTSWYTDYSVMPTAATPWISRGGPYNGGASSGIFAFQSSNGAISSSIGFRPTIPSIIDTTSPVVTLNGDNPVRLKLGRTYIDSGVNATDNSGTDPTIIIKSNINPSVKGTYKVTYIVRDSDGNSTSIDRTVIVDTIEIYTAQDFYNIRNNVTGDYTLMNDIDMSTSEYAANFTAIDNFSGTIDGQEYKISNLKVNTGGIFTNLRTGFEIVDLELNNFSSDSSTLSNVGSITGELNETGVIIDNVSITGTSIIKGKDNVGGIIGKANVDVSLNNINLNATITGTSTYVGGLIGLGGTVNISNVGITGTSSVTSTTDYVGGLIGKATTANITNSYSNANVNGVSNVGGLLGYSNYANIGISSSSGNIKGTRAVGGIVGYIVGTVGNNSLIEKSYFSGSVESTTFTGTDTGAGGILGQAGYTDIQDSYVTGSVKASAGYSGAVAGYVNRCTISRTYVSGLLTNVPVLVGGLVVTTFNNNYWIGDTTTVFTGTNATLISNIIQATDSANYIGFDFDNVWGIEYKQTTPYIKGTLISDKNYLSNLNTYIGDGSGTETDPYIVRTAQDLYNMRKSLGSYFKLANNINMVGSAYQDNFPTINSFNGTLDGNGYTISNLKLTGSLFNSVTSMAVKNIIFDNTTVTSAVANAGIIVGLGGTVNISNVGITGTSNVTSTSDYVGGFIGKATTANISNSYSNANVNGISYVAGFVGYTNYANISISSSTGNIKATRAAGGIAGYIVGTAGNNSLIEKSYFSGSVESTTFTGTDIGAGGILGQAGYTDIQDSYVTGSVKASAGYSGAIVGYTNRCTISRTYVSGLLTNAPVLVGLVVVTTFNNNYWIAPTTGVATGTNATMISTITDAKNAATYTGFDFVNVWSIEPGATSPYLRGLTIPGNVYISG